MRSHHVALAALAALALGILQGCGPSLSQAVPALAARPGRPAAAPDPGPALTPGPSALGSGLDDGLPGEDLGGPRPELADRSGHAVLLVHGLGVNGASLMGMQAYLQAQGVPEVHTVDLPGAGITSTIEECAATVEAFVRDLGQRGIRRVDLVGHSMGGLVIREYLRSRRDRSVEVPTLITVATPNHGNGTVASMLEMIGQKSGISEMAANSDFLARLNASALPAGTRGYGLRTPEDDVVHPSESCILPGGENHSLDVGGLGAHMAMAFHPSSLGLIHRLLVGEAGGV